MRGLLIPRSNCHRNDIRCLIGCRALDVIDDKGFTVSALGYELQAELFLQSGKNGRTIWIDVDAIDPHLLRRRGARCARRQRSGVHFRYMSICRLSRPIDNASPHSGRQQADQLYQRLPSCSGLSKQHSSATLWTFARLQWFWARLLLPRGSVRVAVDGRKV